MSPSPPTQPQQPLVTVVIPHYDGARFLAETLESVRNQTYSNWEIILIDDGSPEESKRLLKESESEKIRIIEQFRGGAGAATQRGIEAAQGEYIAFMDQDDLWLPAKLERHLARFAAEPGIDLTFSAFGLIDDQSRPIDIHTVLPRGRYSFEDLFVDYRIGPTATAVVRTAAAREAGPVDAGLRRYYDLEFFLRVAKLRARNSAAVPERLSLYRRHPGQLSSNVDQMREEWLQVLDRLRKVAPETVGAHQARAHSNMLRYFAFLEYESGSFPQSCSLLFEGFRTAPASFLADRRNWMVGAASFSGLLLPRPVHQWLETRAGLRR